PRAHRGGDGRRLRAGGRRRERPVAMVDPTIPPVLWRAPSIGDRVEYGALRALIRLLGALRWDRAARAGARLGALGYRPFRIRRRVVERQIAAAFPGLTPAETRAIARGAFEHLGRVTV